jgi:hypothetical protein
MPPPLAAPLPALPPLAPPVLGEPAIPLTPPLLVPPVGAEPPVPPIPLPLTPPGAVEPAVPPEPVAPLAPPVTPPPVDPPIAIPLVPPSPSAAPESSQPNKAAAARQAVMAPRDRGNQSWPSILIRGFPGRCILIRFRRREMRYMRDHSNEATMKRSGAKQNGDTASDLITDRIAELDDWRGDMLAAIRALIKQADPDILEEWKWGIPVWSHDGIVCTGETYKSHVKMTFAKGASLKDPSRLFNSSLGGGTRRAIDIKEGEKINAPALKTLFRAAVALNVSGKKTPRRKGKR